MLSHGTEVTVPAEVLGLFLDTMGPQEAPEPTPETVWVHELPVAAQVQEPVEALPVVLSLEEAVP